MCGIIGYIGEENAVDVIINGLEELEYRGYDSAGLAVVDNDRTEIIKTVGSPSNLRKKVDGISGKIGIGHTRWATHGIANETNAHPHSSENGLFTLVHNGIIENYRELKTSLNDVKFKSDTDTEVIVQLLEKNYNGDLKGTVGKVMQKLHGSYALCIMCRDYPDTIVCAKRSSPLFIGISNENGFIASDISAIANKSERIYTLNDGEIGLLKKEGLKIYDTDGCRIRKSEVKIKAFDRSGNKGDYEHFMLKEIMEQPTAVRRTLESIIQGNKIRLKRIYQNSEDIKKINFVRFVACGSAYHAGLCGAYAVERLFHRHSDAVTASEFRYMHPFIDENTLVVIISQSGETADTLAALRLAKKQGAKTISIVNVENSTIAMESDDIILTKAGREIAVATTKAYSAQLAVIYALAIFLARESGEISKQQADECVKELIEIPDKIEKILLGEGVSRFKENILKSNFVCFIGRGFDCCSAMEASLKLKEISYIPSEAYPAGELKHGTISLIDENSLVISLCCCEELKSKTLSNVNEVTARGAKVITVSSDKNADIIIPKTVDFLYPMLEIIPLQLLSYYTAKEKGCAIDKPRNLAKSVTVE